MASEYRTARRFPRPSPPLRWWEGRYGLTPAGRALVLGAGLLLEAEFLADLGWRVDALETPDSVKWRDTYREFEARPGCRVLTNREDAKGPYRLILATHVLEFVENPSDRLALLRHAARRMTKDGRILLSLRGWSDVNAAKHQTPKGDGILTGIGTWTRGFNRDEAEKLVRRVGLVVETSPQDSNSRTPEQVRLVCRKK